MRNMAAVRNLLFVLLLLGGPLTLEADVRDGEQICEVHRGENPDDGLGEYTCIYCNEVLDGYCDGDGLLCETLECTWEELDGTFDVIPPDCVPDWYCSVYWV